jgi:hypothetical protein
MRLSKINHENLIGLVLLFVIFGGVPKLAQAQLDCSLSQITDTSINVWELNLISD